MKTILLILLLALGAASCQKSDNGYMYKVTFYVSWQWQKPTEFYLYPVHNDKQSEQWYRDNFKGRGFDIDSMKIEYYCTGTEWNSSL